MKGVAMLISVKITTKIQVTGGNILFHAVAVNGKNCGRHYKMTLSVHILQDLLIDAWSDR